MPKHHALAGRTPSPPHPANGTLVLVSLRGRAADRLLVSPGQAAACLAMKWHMPRCEQTTCAENQTTLVLPMHLTRR